MHGLTGRLFDPLCGKSSEQGKGTGSRLVSAAIEELDTQGRYDGYFLESSNPRNVPFYERNKFESLGSARIFGCVITNLVRPAAAKSLV